MITSVSIQAMFRIGFQSGMLIIFLWRGGGGGFVVPLA